MAETAQETVQASSYKQINHGDGLTVQKCLHSYHHVCSHTKLSSNKVPLSFPDVTEYRHLQVVHVSLPQLEQDKAFQSIMSCIMTASQSSRSLASSSCQLVSFKQKLMEISVSKL